MNDFITHEEADAFFDDLAYIAIDIPLLHIQKHLKRELKKAEDDKEYKVAPEAQKQMEEAIEYLSKSKELKQSKVEELTHALGQEINKV